MRQKAVQAKEEITKVFSFILIRNRFRKCSLFLLDFITNLLRDSCCTTCCIFSAQIISQLSHVYSHTNFSFEYIYIIFKKIIHEGESFVM